MTGKVTTVACLALCTPIVFSCAEEPDTSLPVPREVIDLGALITEDTPEKFWGKGFLNDMGFAESNEFDVIIWDFGPLTGSNSYYRLFNHGGPHVDAPSHIGLDPGLDDYDIESFTGPLKVFDFSHLEIARSITLEMVSGLPISAGDVVLIYTGYTAPTTDSAWPEAVALTFEAATYLAAIPVRAIGTDAYNVESMTDETPVESDDEIARIIPGHIAFLTKGIPVFEQLVNVDSLLDKKDMYFVGVPLNIEDGDGMMVRPVVLVY